MADSPSNPQKSNNNSPLEELLSQMFAEAEAEPVNTLSQDEIDALGRDLWTWAQTVEIDSPDIRFRNAHGRHYLEVVGPDRPFLVDSLLGACSRQGFEILALFHPIIGLDNGHRRSLIQIHLPELTKSEQDELVEDARKTLNDVVMATSDYHAMRDRMAREVERLAASRHVPDVYKTEAIAFLNWLGSDHFVFLGVRDYTFHLAEDGSVLPEEPEMVEGSNLGVLRDIGRNVLNRGSEPLVLSPEIGEFLAEPEPLVLAKATLESRVHRRTVCDYVGVKHFDEHGQVKGETRFLGLYTSEAYHNSVWDVPLIRRRAARVLEASGAAKGTYTAKALANILESWPRDELIQTNSETLSPILLGALQLIGRPRVRLFSRYDRFNRFVSIITFIPREAYDTRLREKIADALEQAYKGRLVNFEPSFDATSMVRVLFEIALPSKFEMPDLDAIESEVAQLARTWNDRFRSAIMSSALEASARASALKFVGAFNAAYREAFPPEEAMCDVSEIAALNRDHPVKMRAYHRESDQPDAVRAKIYARSGAIALSDCVPVFERMGLFVEFETGYPVRPDSKPADDAPDTYWIHTLSMRRMDGKAVDLVEIGQSFEDTFVAVWSGLAETDGFNALVFTASLTWREAALCRVLCGYRHQTGLDPARSTQIEALNANPALTRALIDLFTQRFDPDQGRHSDDNSLTAARAAIEDQLRSVQSLDHDRVIRRLADLIMATVRTNFYQLDAAGQPHPFISLKIASRDIADLPAPKPCFEIFMSSPTVEGVHCRFGPVARGGLRWSDRRDDYRTEVLGLVKAQQVKNAVIVPVGSKGGFYPKKVPMNGSREEVRDAGIAAYRTFITALLDLTDNLIDGEVQYPERTVIHDGEDPYLVVAADKGTATFSDIANEISQGQGFWLGDAFASGGSAGYDHKKMGITARGAWEAVKRHFREIGTDIQNEPFTVIGCGDMSGDVFGNGMLLSKKIRLQAAFNHMHIFIDPDPVDCDENWTERKRLFDLPRSSWTDYDQALISAGGGIFERSAKAIELTPEIKSMTGLKADSVTPDELVHALLKTNCDLLWFGGIGTYVKASDEAHSAAGDRGNDSIRVNGRQVGAKVVGEGANLGLTQAGRIEFALAGGRINTDAIDNSAGVDSSDHEVNIKILCTEAIRRGDLPSGERNTLLASMTDEVAEHVLAHNYAQTAALSLAEHCARSDHDALERLMLELEERDVLDRDVEGLPSSAEMRERSASGKPLTRPELAVLLAWSKIVLFDDLLASKVPDDPHFQATLQSYFPAPLRRFDAPMQAHRLKREIIATVLANRIVDMGGPVFLLRLHEQTGRDAASIVAAFETSCALVNATSLLSDIHALDNRASSACQTGLQLALCDALAGLTASIALTGEEQPIADWLDQLSDPVSRLRKALPKALRSFSTTRFNKAVKALAKPKVPSGLAEKIVTAGCLRDAPELAAIASNRETRIESVLDATQLIGEALQLDRLRAIAEDGVSSMPYWDRLATRRLIRDLQRQQAVATRRALQEGGADSWLAAHDEARKALVSDIRTFTNGTPAFAQFALAADAVRGFMQAADVPN